jgi:FMN phosphatase YigB (HAD superfamily)
MSNSPLDRVTTLTFDIFGTVLDLTGSLVPPLERFLAARGASVDASSLWAQWRARQRIEQYQDNLLMLGHKGYLDTCRRSLVFCLRVKGVEFTDAQVAEFMEVYQELVSVTSWSCCPTVSSLTSSTWRRIVSRYRSTP